jgi:hypothetical protein
MIFHEGFDNLYGWGNDGSQPDCTVQLSLVQGVKGQAFQVKYGILPGQWSYVQFHKELDRSMYFRLPREYTVVFQLAGKGGANSLDVKFVDADGTNYGASLDIPTDFKGHQYVLTSNDIGFLWGGADEALGEVKVIQFAVTPRKDQQLNARTQPTGAVYFDELLILPGIRNDIASH